MQTMIIAACIICILFTVVEMIGTKKNPVSGLHNLPLDIQERVHSLPEYEGKTEKILSTRERVCKKLPALVIVLLMFAGIVYWAGARTFLQGFGYAFGLWAVVKLYVTLGLSCGWYAHSPAVWIPGTEDMKSSYQNYPFYLSSIPRSLLAGAIVSMVIGGIVVIL